MTKILLIIGLFVSLSLLPAFCFSESDLNAFELKQYGKTYSSDNLSTRLNRLENDLLGMSQTGDFESRMAQLSRVASPNINPNNIVYPKTSYNYNSYNYASTPKRSAIQKFLDNVSEAISPNGVVTGYTPGFYPSEFYGNQNRYYNPQPYCPYHNTFHNNYNNGFYNGFNNRFNNGFNNNFNNGFGGNFPPINNRIVHGRGFHNHYYHNNPYNNYYNRYNPYGNPYYRNYNRFYYPENIVTKSAVHIMKD